MDQILLGRTGLRATVMGLGCGGHSRLGLSAGRTEEEAADIVRQALDLGVNFIDTAEAYGTETAVGRALKGRDRYRVILSTKVSPRSHDRLATPDEIKTRAAACLDRLGVDCVEVLHLHGVHVDDYPYCLEVLYPALVSLRDAGRVRFIGITEAFASDPSHRTLIQAVEGPWDIMMVGFNLLNPSARETVLPRTRERGIGVLNMFAVRRALSSPQALVEVVRDLVNQGLVDTDQLDEADPLGFLLSDGAARTIAEAAYRFCRYEPGIHVVLSGTGNAQHLEENAASLSAPPLPERHLRRLRELFGRVDCVSGN